MRTTFKRIDGYTEIYHASFKDNQLIEKLVGYIVPSPFGVGYLVSFINAQGGVCFKTIAKAKKYAKAVS